MSDTGNAYEDGILFALGLLKSQVRTIETECEDRMRDAGTITGSALHGLRQTAVGMGVHFETALMKHVTERRSAENKAKKKGATP